MVGPAISATSSMQENSVMEELSLAKQDQKRLSPLNAPVWKHILLISAGCASAWLGRVVFGFRHPLAVWIVAFLATISWVAAVRMLLLDSRLKKFWAVWLAGGFLIILLAAGGGKLWTAALSFNLVFLAFRRYRPYRHLPSRRRAAVFLLGALVFGLLTLGFLGSTAPKPSSKEPPSPSEISPAPPSQPSGLGRGLARYSLESLRLFWFFSLLNLFFFMRLHFMKIKPKLAVSALLIAVVPLVLVVLMGFLVLYGTMGESRAARATRIMKDWAALAGKDERFLSIISARTFIYPPREGSTAQGEVPPWLPGFLKALNTQGTLPEDPSTSGDASYVWMDSEIWLMDIRNPGQPDMIIRACQVDATMMNRLANILRADVRLSFSNPIRLMGEGETSVQAVTTDKESARALHGEYRSSAEAAPAGSRNSIRHRRLYFGMTHLDVLALNNDKIDSEKILLLVEVTLENIAHELLSERNPLSLAVMSGLLTLGLLLLILEAFVLYFGIRIASGITSAVKALHQGTRRIAAGDLDTQTILPNEDELGDLAESFNVMTAAIKKGREEAIERERLERELQTAREIQERLLPHKMPQIPGFEISGTSLPSQQVGGDYFDFLDMASGQLGVAIGDVSGKGIPAALLMANLQASLHGLVSDPHEVAAVVSRINNQLVRSTDANMFATFFYGVLDRQRSAFTYTNAGHNPPLLFRADGTLERLKSGGLIIGFLSDQPYEQETVEIRPGDMVVLYTDGITEALAPDAGRDTIELFGEERLVDVVRTSLMRSAREVQATILKAISTYTEDSPQHDDITLVVIKRGRTLL